MKKLYPILCAAGLLGAMLTGCGAKPAKLLANAAPENSALAAYYYDGETVTCRYLYDTGAEKQILEELNALPAQPLEQSALENWSLPCYGLWIASQEGNDLNVAWSEGVWLDQDGNVYQVDADFEGLWNDKDWRDEDIYIPLNFPNAGYLAKYDSNFLQEYVPASTAPEGVSMEVKSYVDNIATVTIDNQSGADFDYSEYYSLLREIDGGWYLVPPVTAWGVNDIAHILNSGAQTDFACDLSWYGNLQPGDYAICKDGLIAELIVW